MLAVILVLVVGTIRLVGCRCHKEAQRYVPRLSGVTRVSDYIWKYFGPVSELPFCCGIMIANQSGHSLRAVFMSGRPQEKRDQAPQEPQRAPLEFAQSRLRHTNYGRRRRNRQYRIMAALVILAVGLGIIVALLTDLLPTFLN